LLLGGVWRLKWRQFPAAHGGLLAAACMYSGWSIIQVDMDFNLAPNINYSGPHMCNSLAYGVDWIADDLLAACSFYDNTISLWSI
jgi:hypothetical protein